MALAALKEVEEVFARPTAPFVAPEADRTRVFNPRLKALEVSERTEIYVRFLKKWLVDMKAAADPILASNRHTLIIELRVLTVNFLREWDRSSRGFQNRLLEQIHETQAFDRQVRAGRRPTRAVLIETNRSVVRALERARLHHAGFGQTVRSSIVERCDEFLRSDVRSEMSLADMFEDMSERYPVVTEYLGR